MRLRKHESADYEIIKCVDNFSSCKLNYYYNNYNILNLKHYVLVQSHWILTSKYYLGIKLRRNPTEIETIDDWFENNTSKRFRAFYVLKYPDRVELLEPEYLI